MLVSVSDTTVGIVIQIYLGIVEGSVVASFCQTFQKTKNAIDILMHFRFYLVGTNRVPNQDEVILRFPQLFDPVPQQVVFEVPLAPCGTPKHETTCKHYIQNHLQQRYEN